MVQHLDPYPTVSDLPDALDSIPTRYLRSLAELIRKHPGLLAEVVGPGDDPQNGVEQRGEVFRKHCYHVTFPHCLPNRPAATHHSSYAVGTQTPARC